MVSGRGVQGGNCPANIFPKTRNILNDYLGGVKTEKAKHLRFTRRAIEASESPVYRKSVNSLCSAQPHVLTPLRWGKEPSIATQEQHTAVSHPLSMDNPVNMKTCTDKKKLMAESAIQVLLNYCLVNM
jgi:hypothetical protein